MNVIYFFFGQQSKCEIYVRQVLPTPMVVVVEFSHF